MKVSMIILILFQLINISCAKTLVKTSQNYSRKIFKQKMIPMKIEQSFQTHLLTVNFIAEENIESFSLVKVRGVDGVNVDKFQELLYLKLNTGEAIESSVELSDFVGLVYIVFDVSLTINGVTQTHSIPVAVGSLSETQVSMRSKNIKTIKNITPQNKGGSALSAPDKKIHEMKVD